MDNIQVRNSPRLRKFIREHPEQIPQASADWENIATKYPEIRSFKSAEQWYTWIASNPGVDTSLWVSREIQVVASDKQDDPPTSPEDSTPATSSIPGTAGFGKMLGVLSDTFKKAEILESDWNYLRVEYEKQNEWLKKNKKENFLSKEGLDYLYGSLDNPEVSPLNQETIEQLTKNANGDKKLQKKLDDFALKRKALHSDMQHDPYVAITQRGIEQHASERFELFINDNPDATTEEREKKWNELFEEVQSISWQRFALQHPEKALEYAKEEHNKYNEPLKKALKVIETRKLEAQKRLNNISQKYTDQTDALKRKQELELQETKKKWAEKQQKEGAHLIEDITGAYQERYPQKGLANIHNDVQSNQKDKEESQSIQLPRRRDIQQAVDAMEDSLSQPEEPEVENPPAEEPPAQPPQQPSEPQQPSSPPRIPRRPVNVPFLRGTTGQLTGFGLRALLMYIGIPLLIVLILIIIGVVILYSNNTSPGVRDPNPYAPGPGGGEIAQCQFTRAGNKYYVRSAKLQQHIVNAAAKAGIPSSILASVAMHETLDFVANAQDDHDSLVSNNYCISGPPFCELRGQAISTKACTPDQLARGARTGTAKGIMQLVDIYHPVNACSITDSLDYAANKLKKDGVTDRPEKADVLEAIRRYYNACRYGSHNYCEDVWADYQSCLIAQTPARPTNTPTGTRPVAPASNNLAEDIRKQFGITMEGFGQQHMQWAWEKLWEVSQTNFPNLVKNTKVIASNESAQINNFTIRLVAYNDEQLFKVVFIHEFGHIIRWRTDAKVGDVKQAINAEGYLTSYSSNSGGCASGRQFDEDYAEMIAYYLSPDTPSRTSRCSSGSNPFSSGANPLHYNIAREILGAY